MFLQWVARHYRIHRRSSLEDGLTAHFADSARHQLFSHSLKDPLLPHVHLKWPLFEAWKRCFGARFPEAHAGQLRGTAASLRHFGSLCYNELSDTSLQRKCGRVEARGIQARGCIVPVHFEGYGSSQRMAALCWLSLK